MVGKLRVEGGVAEDSILESGCSMLDARAPAGGSRPTGAADSGLGVLLFVFMFVWLFISLDGLLDYWIFGFVGKSWTIVALAWLPLRDS